MPGLAGSRTRAFTIYRFHLLPWYLFIYFFSLIFSPLAMSHDSRLDLDVWKVTIQHPFPPVWVLPGAGGQFPEGSRASGVGHLYDGGGVIFIRLFWESFTRKATWLFVLLYVFGLVVHVCDS